MLGTIVNTCTILTGSCLGCVIKKGIKEEYQGALFNAMGLAATGLGINAIVQNMPKSQFPVLFIISLAAGSLIGTILDLNGKFNRLTNRFGASQLSKGLSTAILLFCIGTLSILGPMQSALYGDNTYLFTNATLDFVTSMVLASTYGLGIAIAAIVLFLWQGSIYVHRFSGGFSHCGSADGDLHRGRLSHRQLRTVHPECQGLQDVEHAAGAFDSSRLVCHLASPEPAPVAEPKNL